MKACTYKQYYDCIYHLLLNVQSLVVTVKLGLHGTILCRVFWVPQESAGVKLVIQERDREFSSRAGVFQPPALIEP